MALVSVACLFLFLELGAATTPKYVAYNSSDLSYLSNGIQIPVPSIEQDPVIQEIADVELPHMEWMSRLYNHHNWEKRLSAVENKECRRDLGNYLASLRNGTLWAVQMYDAAGKYSSQFFFGNDYWLGSSTLCTELELAYVNGDAPPFPVHFFIAKIRININEDLTPVTRQVNLGQCLPRSCTTSDVRRLLIQERSQAKSMSVVGVRAVPGDYSMLMDYKLHIIGGVGLVIVILIIMGSIVDYHTCKIKSDDVEMNNNDGNPTNTKNSKEISHKEKLASIVEFNTKLLLCFSALRNGKKILNVDHPPKESVNCLHGLRFFSIAWIILVHTYLEVFAIADNKSFRIVTERSFHYQTISNATFSVDTFFFISGLLVTIGYLRKEYSKSSEKPPQSIKTGFLQYFVILFYRYVRLTPAYLFVLGLNELAMRYLHSNSVFSPAIIDHISCTKYWWRNALYINNFFPQHEFCMLWSWYMSNDTQFFALAMILLTIAIRNVKCFRYAVAALIVFMLSSWATTFTIAMKYNYVARIEAPFALFDQLYDKPWLRIGPYFVGMATGYLLLKTNKKTIPKGVVVVCWIASIACLASLVYGLGREGLTTPISAIYASLGHTAWSLCLAWITLACYMGYGGPVHAILSFRGILPFSKLTYCAYLVHPMIMCITSFQMDGPIHLHHGIILVIFFGNLVASFFMAFAISLGFEAPFVAMLRLISRK